MHKTACVYEQFICTAIKLFRYLDKPKDHIAA